jgi:hypothetical protein
MIDHDASRCRPWAESLRLAATILPRLHIAVAAISGLKTFLGGFWRAGAIVRAPDAMDCVEITPYLWVHPDEER